ncbi:MAG: alpha/beta fold hydrolase [Acidimicrobiales bacterium]|nr:alpha/beta fold hydrolase [Acidimicrobiales bacterium]
MTPRPLPGAEPLSAPGGPHGALVLHGFTGCPHSMRGLAEAFAAAGFAVELPLLPGHGTSVNDMLETSWADWSAAAEAAYLDLAARCDRVVVAGLSMGGTLTCWLATRHPEIAGIVCINAAAEKPDEHFKEIVQGMLDQGLAVMPGIGSDIADPDVRELAYEETPLAPLLSLFAAFDDLGPRLGGITCPALVMTSPQDHVVPPTSSDLLAASVGGPVERVTLERSYHVATLDHDRALIEEAAVSFAHRVVGAP